MTTTIGPVAWVAVLAIAALAAPGRTAASEAAANSPSVAPTAPGSAAKSGHASSDPGSTPMAPPDTAGGRGTPAALAAPEHSDLAEHPTPKPPLDAPTARAAPPRRRRIVTPHGQPDAHWAVPPPRRDVRRTRRAAQHVLCATDSWHVKLLRSQLKGCSWVADLSDRPAELRLYREAPECNKTVAAAAGAPRLPGRARRLATWRADIFAAP